MDSGLSGNLFFSVSFDDDDGIGVSFASVVSLEGYMRCIGFSISDACLILSLISSEKKILSDDRNLQIDVFLKKPVHFILNALLSSQAIQFITF